MRKIAIIVNPVAGNGKTIDTLPIIKDVFNKYKDTIELKIMLSKNKGDVTALANTISKEGINEFIAVGGDGTLSELINGLDYTLNTIYKVGIIPWGTGNDFIKSLNNEKNIVKILNNVVENRLRIIDLGKVNEHYFINVCSFGIDGPIIRDTEKLKKVFPGHPAYLISTLKSGLIFKAQQTKVTVDDREYKGNMILIAVGNGKYIGGGMNVCPDAKIDDGLFEVCLVNNVSKLTFMKEIGKVYKGRLGEVEEVIYDRGKEISIQVEGIQYQINVDGNLIGTTPSKIRFSKHKIYVYAD
ncbi:MAG: diacylglycerol kinase family lipid kinase [Clostridia bacterium]|nr:diacylglycerol kinase family lipid kinase [Clostridia bacterium]